MAFNSFSNLTPRVRSKIVSEIFTLVKYYGHHYGFRQRADLTRLSLHPSNPICWVKDQQDQVSAAIITDPKYNLIVDGVELQLIGHILSNAIVSINPLIQKTINTHKHRSLAILCSKQLGDLFGLSGLGFTQIHNQHLEIIWPSLAKIKTDYFNVYEPLVEGLARKNLQLYYLLTPKDYRLLESNNCLPQSINNFKVERIAG